MWKDARTGNGRYDSFYGIPNFNTKAFRAACQADCGLNDNITSLRNKDANKNVRLWEHTNYSGGVFWRKWYNTTDRYDEADDLSLNSFSNGVNANDEVSSFCFVYPSNPVSQCRGPVR